MVYLAFDLHIVAAIYMAMVCETKVAVCCLTSMCSNVGSICRLQWHCNGTCMCNMPDISVQGHDSVANCNLQSLNVVFGQEGALLGASLVAECSPRVFQCSSRSVFWYNVSLKGVS